MRQTIIDWANLLQGLRKVIIMILLMIIAVVFRIKGYMDGGNVVDLLKATGIAFFGCNAAEHFTAMVRDHLASKNAAVAVAGDSNPIPVTENDSPQAGS